MARRAVLAVALALCLASSALAGEIDSRKGAVDSRIADLRDRISRARAEEAVLSAEIAGVTTRIRTLEGRVGGVSARLATLERDLALHRERLTKLTALFRLETRRYAFLRREYALALERLNRRLVDIYESNDPTTLDVVLSAASFSELVEQLDYLSQIGRQDERIATAVGEAKNEVRIARERTRVVRAGVATATRTIAVRAAQQREVRNQLVSSRDALSSARQGKLQSLTSLKESERADAEEAEALSAVSGRLATRIQAAQEAARAAAAAEAAAQAARQDEGAEPSPPAEAVSSPLRSFASATPSASGLIWPAGGPVTSSFGWRWGRMHEGIDIAAGFGASIQAAAAGTVIYAGWEDGYGNLTIIDHGGALATAYAHQSSIAVSVGQYVEQGASIGAIGSTGHSFGPHLHFEVRVNGSAVDPLGYL